MDVMFFKPFVEGTVKTLEVQANVKVSPGKPFYKEKNKKIGIDIAGVIGLASPTFHGSITLCFPQAVFLHIMNSMLDEGYQEINDEVEDGAAELLNIIFGHAKVVLNEKGYEIEKAIPSVIRGTDLTTTSLSKEPIITLPFNTPAGEFYIEISAEG